MFGTEVRFVNNAALQMILTPWLVNIGLVLADTARRDVLVAMPVLVVDAFGAVCCTDCAVTGTTKGVMIGTETFVAADAVCTI